MSRPTRDGGDDGGFLARWSRRKLTPKEQLPEEPDDSLPPEAARVVQTVAETEDAVDEAELSDEELLVRYELPDPSSLTVADDVSAFMRSGIPTRLRNLALRRMWKLHPMLANLDGLVEYNDDYTDAATVIPNLKTTYQVGRGAAAYLQDALEKAKLLGESEESEDAPMDADDVALANESDADASAITDDGASELDAEQEQPAERPVEEAVVRRRHMVFAAPGARDQD